MSQNNPSGFQVKICGVKSIGDIVAIGDAAADEKIAAAVGLNFYPPSVRYLSPDDPQSKEISDAASKADLVRVGVFVNESVESVQRTCDLVGLDVVQLHGDEPEQIALDLMKKQHKVIRAIKLPKHELSVNTITDRVAPWLEIGCHVLLDADAGASHGGSGKTLDWGVIAEWAKANPTTMWTLAGGLNPENVAQSIEKTGAKSVDTASGVEQPRGSKSAGLIQEFIRSAAAAMSLRP